jgi:hypothetical protein
MERIFISSTVYDLVDVRAEVSAFISDLGLTPILSGSVSGDFRQVPDANSIESCLANVRRSEAMILVLSQRYGPTLKKAGFRDVSATHLEYDEARKQNIPIYMYVRDRLEADYSIWKKNKDATDIKFSWVKEEHDRRLFDIVHAHQSLAKQAKHSNWYDLFRDSLELKALIKRDFHLHAGRADLERLIRDDVLPMISIDSVVNKSRDVDRISQSFVFKNTGKATAYDVRWKSTYSDQDHTLPALPPGVESAWSRPIRLDDLPLEETVDVLYKTAHSHQVVDRHVISISWIGVNAFQHGCEFESKRFVVAARDAKPPYTIEDSPIKLD